SAFRELKNELLSTLDALLTSSGESYLLELRKDVADTAEIDPDAIALRHTGGSEISRDMRALSAGTRIYPAHLTLIAQIDQASAYCHQVAKLVGFARRFSSYVKKKALVTGMAANVKTRDPKAVFLICGRNTRVLSEMEKFLMSLGLRPLTF